MAVINFVTNPQLQILLLTSDMKLSQFLEQSLFSVVLIRKLCSHIVHREFFK